MTAAALLIAVDFELGMDLLHCCNLYFLRDHQYQFPFEHLKYEAWSKYGKKSTFKIDKNNSPKNPSQKLKNHRYPFLDKNPSPWPKIA